MPQDFAELARAAKSANVDSEGLAVALRRNLRGEVLCRFGGAEAKGKKAFPLGSLGPEVSPDFDKTFDIVIGNPPWTRLRDDKDEDGNAANKKASKSATDELNKAFTAIGRRVLTARGLDDLAKRFQNPDKNPDLPFLWRATEWAKDGGVIALAMPARLFGRTSGKGFEAWRAVLRSVELTGLIKDMRAGRGTAGKFMTDDKLVTELRKRMEGYTGPPVNKGGVR